MIFKKSEIKLVPATELVKTKASTFNFEDVDAPMLTNVMFDRMAEMGGVALSAPQVGLDMACLLYTSDAADE